MLTQTGQMLQNWSGGVPGSGFTAIVPVTPQGGVFPIYEGSYLIDYSIQNGGTLTFNTIIYNLGDIINYQGRDGYQQ